MSWKSLVTASLLCVLASPAFAVPQLEITSGGLDPTTGNWVWNVRIAPTNNTTPVATELGFTANGALKAVANADATSWDTNTAGNQIFNWETAYNTPAKPEGIEANCTGCTITNAAALPATNGHPSTVVNGALNQVFAALGSADNLTLSTPAGTTIGASVPYLTIQTAGPTNTALTSSITLSGSYSGSGHISEITSGSNPTNYKGFSGLATRTVKAGDITLDGTVNLSDLSILGNNYNGTGKNWTKGDFTGDGQVNLSDLSILGNNYNQTGGSTTNLTLTGVADTPGAGAGLGSAAVPEPASIALLGLAVLGSLGLVGRKR
jgi:hypothetical protein